MDDRTDARDTRPIVAAGEGWCAETEHVGLAMMIFIAMILMIVGALVVFAFIGRAIARKVAPGRQGLIMVLTALVGAGLGWLWVMATFYNRAGRRRPSLSLRSPRGSTRRSS